VEGRCGPGGEVSAAMEALRVMFDWATAAWLAFSSRRTPQREKLQSESPTLRRNDHPSRSRARRRARSRCAVVRESSEEA
jgi:hypothetical protein